MEEVMARKKIHVRAGDRVIFDDSNFEKEGVVEEVSPSGKRVKIRYYEVRTYWFKSTVIIELLRPLPTEKRWYQ